MSKSSSAFDRMVQEVKTKKLKADSDNRGSRVDDEAAPKAPKAPKARQRAKRTIKRSRKGIGGGVAKHEFAKFVQSKGITMAGLAEKLNIKPAILWHLSTGNSSPNHPAIALLAAGLGVPEAEIAKYAKRNPIASGKQIVRSARAMVAKRQSKREVVVEAEITPAPSKALARTNGANGKHAGKHSLKGTSYNRLKKLHLDVRQSTRTLITTMNVAVMDGHTHVPPLAVGDLYLVLHDYLKEKGVPGNVLVDPQFAAVFDRKL